MKKSSLPGAVSARPGPCEDREFELMEYVDGAAPTTAGLERHLEACGPCRAFVAELTALTGSLRQTLPPPALAADFDAKLRERIGRLTRSSARLEALAAEERAFAELMARLRRGLRWSTALNALATGSACAGSLTAIAAIAPGLFASLSLNPSGAAIAQLAVGAVAVAGGLFAAYTLRQPMSLEPSD